MILKRNLHCGAGPTFKQLDQFQKHLQLRRSKDSFDPDAICAQGGQTIISQIEVRDEKIGEMVNFPRNVSSSVTFAFTHLHFDLGLEYF